MSLRDTAKKASENAYCHYSTKTVGCALVTEDGTAYSGCNIENASYGGTVCAERVAIWKAVSEGHRKIKKLYVYTPEGWPPCGMCLQVMTEFADPELEITLGDDKGKETSKKLKDFLPLAFTPKHM